MKRKIKAKISKYLQEELQKKALLITGARQIGKTYIIRECLGEHFSSVVEINFIENENAKRIFSDFKDTKDILLRLSAIADKPLIAGETVVFLDEVQECKEIVNIINKSGANVVLVGVGAPKQEKWIMKWKHLMPGVKVWMALGATIDFEAGNVKRAPKIYQKLAMEWLYRFTREPKRLFHRYFVDDIKFFWYFGKQLLGVYKDPFAK